MSPEVLAAALFCTDLQPSEFPNGAKVRLAVGDLQARLDEGACAAVVAQEYGDHPAEAPMRMQWALHTVAWAFTPVVA